MSSNDTYDTYEAGAQSEGGRGNFWFGLIFTLVAGIALFIGHSDHKRDAKNLANEILGNYISKAKIEVDYIRFPFWRAIPFIDIAIDIGLAPSEYHGYFSIKRKDSSTMPRGCDAETIDYAMRSIGDYRVAMSISGEGMATLYRCN